MREIASQEQAVFHIVGGVQQKKEIHNFSPMPLQGSAFCLK
jgi:hypothetical protein